MKVFLSSTYKDLVPHRAAAADAIERLEQQVVRMEVFGARSSEATVACLEKIDDAEAFVGLYAHQYGHVPNGSSISITEQEFVHARASGKQMFCFLVDESYPWVPKHIEGEPGRTLLHKFKQRIQAELVRDTFSSPDDVAYKVSASLGRSLVTSRIEKRLANLSDAASTALGRSQIARRAARIQPLVLGAHVLLVNDSPSGMNYVIDILQEVGLEIRVVRSTAEALKALSTGRFDVVISDMARDGIEDEGLRLLRKMRSNEMVTPVIFSVGRLDPERGTPPFAFGITSSAEDIFNLVFDALERQRG